jgi:hypothetical protein
MIFPLVRILQADVRVEPWRKRQRIVEAVCRAFIRLGPDAAGALPAVLELFGQPPPLADDSSHRSWWRIAWSAWAFRSKRCHFRRSSPASRAPLKAGPTSCRLRSAPAIIPNGPGASINA